MSCVMDHEVYIAQYIVGSRVHLGARVRRLYSLYVYVNHGSNTLAPHTHAKLMPGNYVKLNKHWILVGNGIV